MLTIIHGNDTASSRNFFLQQKKQTENPITLSGESITLTDLTQTLEGGELFVQSKHLFIEQFFSKKKKSKERDAISAYLQAHAADHDITLWEDKEIEKTSLSQFKTSVIRDFKLPQSLFTFLDNLKPNNAKLLISLFHKTLATTEPEMIFFMLIRHIRLMLALSSLPMSLRGEHDSIQRRNVPYGTFRSNPLQEQKITSLPSAARNDKEQIFELKRLAQWQKTKIENQAKLIGGEKMLQIYKQLFEIEIAQKTGTLSGSLTAAIDFFLFAI